MKMDDIMNDVDCVITKHDIFLQKIQKCSKNTCALSFSALKTTVVYQKQNLFHACYCIEYSVC